MLKLFYARGRAIESGASTNHIKVGQRLRWIKRLTGTAMGELRNNTDLGRYEIEHSGAITFARYRLDGDHLYIDWVETPAALRGSGAAGRLMTAIAEEARRNNWKITPICGYAASWLRGSKTYRDLAF
ncbi:MAG: GNAT family N-acetyltransferase [Hyphomonadaceae bacterium]